MGTQTWVCITILFTETLIVLKFDWETVTKPFPPNVAWCWIVFIIGLILWTIWQFSIKPLIHSDNKKPSGYDQNHDKDE